MSRRVLKNFSTLNILTDALAFQLFIQKQKIEMANVNVIFLKAVFKQ